MRLSVTASAHTVLSSTDLHSVYGGCWHCSFPARGNRGTGWRETRKAVLEVGHRQLQAASLPWAISCTLYKPSIWRLVWVTGIKLCVCSSPPAPCLVQLMVLIVFSTKRPGLCRSFSFMVYRTCTPMKLPFPLWARGLDGWKPPTEILPNHSHELEDNQIFLCKFYSGTFHVHICEIRTSGTHPFSFIPQTQADHPLPCTYSSTGSAPCSCSRHPLSPSSPVSSFGETFLCLL